MKALDFFMTLYRLLTGSNWKSNLEASVEAKKHIFDKMYFEPIEGSLRALRIEVFKFEAQLKALSNGDFESEIGQQLKLKYFERQLEVVNMQLAFLTTPSYPEREPFLNRPVEMLTTYLSCPCLYLLEPCHPTCTCVQPLSSSGCRYCCTYGSLEQRQENAKRLAQKLRKD